MVYWHWLMIGCILMGVEVLLPGVFMLWLGIAALMVGSIQFFIPALTTPFALLLFGVFGLLSAYIGKKIYNRFNSAPTSINNTAARLIGQVATLSKPLVNRRGEVYFHDSYWIVTGPDLPAGTPVKIIEVTEEMELKVEKV